MSPLAARTAVRTVPRPLVLGVAGLGLLGALAGCSTAADTGTSDSSSGSSGSSGSGSSSSGGTSSATGYTDGTYTEDGTYSAPSGTETITVEVTLADNTITAVTVTPQAEGGTQANYQEKFAEGIGAEVVGKSIDEVNVSRVAGSSLTSAGFNDAIEAIKADAAA